MDYIDKLEHLQKQDADNKSWFRLLEFFIIPLIITIIGFIGSKQIANGNIEANKVIEINKLIKDLYAGKSDDVRKAAATGLLLYEDKALPSLVHALEHKKIYSYIIRLLRNIGDSSVEYLYDIMLTEKDSDDVINAIKAIGDIGIKNQEIINTLHNLVKNASINRAIKTQAFITLLKFKENHLFSKSVLKKFQLDLTNVSFSKNNILNIEGMNFSYMKFKNISFNNTFSQNTDFNNCIIDGDGYFRDSDFSNSNFSNAIIKGSDFSRTEFMHANFENSELIDVNFDSSDLSHANFNKATLINVSFHNAILNEANFIDATEYCTSIQAAISINNIKGIDRCKNDR